MENNIQISINSKPGYGYNLTRTSYDLRQELNAKVIGVLKYNNDIREKLLSKNIGKYSNSNLNEGIGYLANVYSNEDNKPLPLGGDGLLGYTHLTFNDYQQYIKNKYDIPDFIQFYTNPYDTNTLKWRGLYKDYYEFIDAVYGIENTSLNLLYGNIDIEQSKISTIKPNVLASMSGVLTTNGQNVNKSETPLGFITNDLYARSLYIGAIVNSERNTQHITPGVYDILGNKLSTLATLGFDLKTDFETGRLAYDLSNNVYAPFSQFHKINHEIGENSDFYASYNIEDAGYSFFDDIDSENRDIFNSQHALKKNLQRNKFLPFFLYQDTIIDNEYNIVQSPIKRTMLYKNYMVWHEGDKKTTKKELSDTKYVSDNYVGITDYLINNTNYDLLDKTQNLFQEHKTDTLVARFHTDQNKLDLNEVNIMQTAVTSFGLSHGRNLLTKTAYKDGVDAKTNNYSNPYCRTWTYHHQYAKIGNLIRPFSESDSNMISTEIIDIDKLQENWFLHGRRKGSAQRLKDNTVLNRNGFINITPVIDQTNNKGDITKCMFSIENLAWKDVKKEEANLSAEQTGPNGGRIMWFPPYGLTFSEQVSANWSQNEFIGRGEKIYTYTNTDRRGNLSFMLLVDHPSILEFWKKSKKNSNVLKEEEKEDREQEILRFFAGCDRLEIDNKGFEFKKPEPVPEPQPEEKPKIEEKTPDIVFYVFFPNNYTGYDEINEHKIPDNAFSHMANEYESKDWKYNDKPLYSDENLRPYKWTYRVDKTYYDEIMVYPENYYDKTNYNFNYDIESLKSHEDFKDATHSFYELYHNTQDVFENLTVVSAEVQGFASSHGYEANNKELQNRRANFAKSFLKEYIIKDESKITKKEGSTITVKTKDKENVSGESAKLARCAKFILHTKKREKIEPLLNLSPMLLQVPVNETIKLPTITTKAEKRALKKNSKKEREKIDERLRQETYNAMQKNMEEFHNENMEKMQKNWYNTMSNLHKTASAEFDKKFIEIEKKKQERLEKERQLKEYMEKAPDKRWEEEAQYFEMLRANDSFLYTKIIDKIKYFTPAFHSITPEGFNARLAFLHQCTRQGNTCGVSDQGSNSNQQHIRSAGNLAFGRPPICILRIGDFYNTKIIIESVNISYENNQWDMNPEGIGVQPMFAKIDISFVFLGGSDIEAPISRLQNALSFNYYANQSIYDNRADIGKYNDGKAVIQGTPWKPKNN